MKKTHVPPEHATKLLTLTRKGSKTVVYREKEDEKPKKMPCSEFDGLRYSAMRKSTKSGDCLVLDKKFRYKTANFSIINDFYLEYDQPDLEEGEKQEIIDKYIEKIAKNDPGRYKDIHPRSWKP